MLLDHLADRCLDWTINQRTPGAKRSRYPAADFQLALAMFKLGLTAEMPERTRQAVLSSAASALDVLASPADIGAIRELSQDPEVIGHADRRWRVLLPLLNFQETAEDVLWELLELDLPRDLLSSRDGLVLAVLTGGELPVSKMGAEELASRVLDGRINFSTKRSASQARNLAATQLRT
jgi:hypothetical protein